MSRIPHDVMADEMSKALRACNQWLEDHSGKRPEHEVAVKQRRSAALAQAFEDYRKAAERQSA